MKVSIKQKATKIALTISMLSIAVISNTAQAGWEAPQRWYNLVVNGKPFWSAIKRKNNEIY